MKTSSALTCPKCGGQIGVYSGNCLDCDYKRPVKHYWAVPLVLLGVLFVLGLILIGIAAH